MTNFIDTYQQEAFKIAANLTNREYQINAAMGIAGEIGEIVDHVKKHKFHHHPLVESHVIKEIGDVVWYCALDATVLGVSLSDLVYSYNLTINEDLIDICLSLSAVSGEVAYVTRLNGQSMNLLHKSIQDIMLLCQQLCLCLGVTLEQCMQRNLIKLQKRYPDGFSAQKSLSRTEVDDDNYPVGLDEA